MQCSQLSFVRIMISWTCSLSQTERSIHYLCLMANTCKSSCIQSWWLQSGCCELELTRVNCLTASCKEGWYSHASTEDALDVGGVRCWQAAMKWKVPPTFHRGTSRDDFASPNWRSLLIHLAKYIWVIAPLRIRVACCVRHSSQSAHLVAVLPVNSAASLPTKYCLLDGRILSEGLQKCYMYVQYMSDWMSITDELFKDKNANQS